MKTHTKRLALILMFTVCIGLLTPTSVAHAAAGFDDVPNNAYYVNAVSWAKSSGITGGTSDTTFSPDAPCTRGQIVTFLWRANGTPSVSSAKNFVDVSASDYCYFPVQWAAANNITSGISDDAFGPQNSCNRAQAVTFLWRSKGCPASSSPIAFVDVPGNAYYSSAVSWAVENGITSGTSEITFSPEAVCNRAQIVTFLYRTANPSTVTPAPSPVPDPTPVAPIPDPAPEPTPAPVEPVPTTYGYVLNTNSHIFHHANCSAVSKMSEKNKKYSSDSRDTIISQGYKPCSICNP